MSQHEHEVVVVFTDESIERIFRKGGTSAWRLDRNNARRCPYVLCTRNAHTDRVNGAEEHHTGFLVGKVRDVVPAPGSHDGDRYLVQFSEYADVNLPGAWNKGDRNPIRYSTLQEIEFDPSALEWKPMPEPAETGSNPEPDGHTLAAPLTLAEAKKGLALTFGVAPEAIEITIRA